MPSTGGRSSDAKEVFTSSYTVADFGENLIEILLNRPAANSEVAQWVLREDNSGINPGVVLAIERGPPSRRLTAEEMRLFR
jgi:hypothetical protein